MDNVFSDVQVNNQEDGGAVGSESDGDYGYGIFRMIGHREDIINSKGFPDQKRKRKYLIKNHLGTAKMKIFTSGIPGMHCSRYELPLS